MCTNFIMEQTLIPGSSNLSTKTEQLKVEEEEIKFVG